VNARITKLTCFGVISVLFLITSSWAVDLPVAWDAASGATGYKLYQSLDGGITWSPGADMGNVTSAVLVNVAETGLILYRLSAYNANGETITTWQGAWYDHTKRPPDAPVGLRF